MVESCLRWISSVVGEAENSVVIRQYVANPVPQTLEQNVLESLFASIPSDVSGPVIDVRIPTYSISETFIDNEGDQCWMHVITTAHIGAHVALPLRNSMSELWYGRGMRVPFEILLQISGAYEFIQSREGPFICGIQTALFPIKVLDDGSIQWHLIVSREEMSGSMDRPSDGTNVCRMSISITRKVRRTLAGRDRK